jgi:tRNA-specific 2-thiouridylase
MHAEFVAQRRGTTDNRGQIVTTDGDIVGEHEGIERFTIGQRKGLGLALGEPVYVVHIDADSKSVTVGRHADLARRQLTANRANWLQRIQPDWQPCLAQIRYNSAATPARFRPLSHDRFEVTFDQPCFGVAPGQAVVCYNENRVMGGGWIE